MSTWQQTQTPRGAVPAPTPPRYYPRGAPSYPNPDGEGRSPPPPYTPQAYYGAPNIPPQNNSYTAPIDFGFTDKTLRKNFMSKVYSILMVQFLITLIFVAMGTFHGPTKLYFKEHPFLIVIAFVATFGTLIALTYRKDLRRKSPTNCILLFVLTFAESLLLAMYLSYFYYEQVLLGLGLTALICFALTIFAFQTKIDFTVMRGFLMVATIVLLVASIVAIFFPEKLMALIIASAGVIMFSLHAIYDIQIMVDGNHKYSISPEEYIFATLNIYVDVIYVVMFTLGIIGNSDDD